MAQLNATGSPADWLSLSRGKAGRASRVMLSVADVVKSFAGQAARPDLATLVSSGLFDLSVEAVTAFFAAGVDGLGDTDHWAVFNALSFLRSCRAQPGCEAKIRSVAPALAFCLENSLDVVEELGATTQSRTHTCTCMGLRP